MQTCFRQPSCETCVLRDLDRDNALSRRIKSAAGAASGIHFPISGPRAPFVALSGKSRGRGAANNQKTFLDTVRPYALAEGIQTK